MMRPGTLLGLLVAGAVGAGGLVFGWNIRNESGRLEGQTRFLEKRVELLEAENLRLLGLVDRLSRAGAVDDPEAVIRRDLEQVTGEIRRLEWKHPATFKVVPGEGIRELFLASLVSSEAAADSLRRRERSWGAMGWLPPETDLERILAAFFSGTATAFYDPGKGTLYVAREAALENANERVLLVNELTRALQDQHFDLEAFLRPGGGEGEDQGEEETAPGDARRNSDELLARRALSSGDAALLTSHYAAESGAALTGFDAERGEFGTAASLAAPSSEDDPLWLWEAFSHSRGQIFCQALDEGDGFSKIDAAYRDPPASTAEILHPELYLEGDFSPRQFAWGAAALANAGGELLWSDVAGEWGVHTLVMGVCSKQEAAAAAAGWHGDRYVVFEAEDGADVFWQTQWRTPGDADEFVSALGSFEQRRYGLKEPLRGSYDGERFLRLEKTASGSGVILVDAGSAGRRRSLGNLEQ